MIRFSFLLLLFVVIAVFLVKPAKNQTPQTAESWISYSFDLLKFSTQMPNTWSAFEAPHRESVLFNSDIRIYESNEAGKDGPYTVSVKRLKLENNETLEDFFFPKDEYRDRSKLFQKEESGDYRIYTTSYLNNQDDMLSVFITKDEKNFLRYSFMPYMKENPSKNQNQFMERFKKLVQSTKLL